MFLSEKELEESYSVSLDKDYNFTLMHQFTDIPNKLSSQHFAVRKKGKGRWQYSKIELRFNSPVFGHGFEEEFKENNRNFPLPFSLCIDTRLSFAESVDFFRDLGITENSVINACCEDNLINGDNIVYFSSLTPEKIRYITGFDDISLDIKGEAGTAFEDIRFDFSYHKKKQMVRPPLHYIGVQANKMIPHFPQVLKAYPHELKQEEISMLEAVIQAGLRL